MVGGLSFVSPSSQGLVVQSHAVARLLDASNFLFPGSIRFIMVVHEDRFIVQGYRVSG